MSHSKGPRQQLSDINVQHPGGADAEGRTDGQRWQCRSRVKFQTTSVLQCVPGRLGLFPTCLPSPRPLLLAPGLTLSLYVSMVQYVALITKTQHVLPCCVPVRARLAAALPHCLTAPVWHETAVAVALTVALPEVDQEQAEWLNAAVIAATCNATGRRVAQMLKHCGSNKNNIRFGFGFCLCHCTRHWLRH